MRIRRARRQLSTKGGGLKDSATSASLGFHHSHENVCTNSRFGAEAGEIVSTGEIEDGEIVGLREFEEGEIEAAYGKIKEGLVVLDNKPNDPWSERRAELIRRYGTLIEKSAKQLRTAEHAAVGRLRKKTRYGDVSEIIDIESVIKHRERDEFRRTIAAVKKTVEISCGSDFHPLLVSTFGKRYARFGLGYSGYRCTCRKVFEAATGLMLIPETD